MNSQEILKIITDKKIVAVLRLDDKEQGIPVTEALIKGGVSIIELTLTTPNAFDVISQLSKEFADDALIGVGSVLNSEMAKQSIDAGAKYVVSPILKKEIIDYTHSQNLPVMPGAFSPTEILQASEWGADVVKVFPADVLGMKYFKGIKAPMPHLNIMPTGGVSLTNAGDWIKAGACAVGAGSSLLDKNAINSKEYNVLTKNAEIIVASVKESLS